MADAAKGEKKAKKEKEKKQKDKKLKQDKKAKKDPKSLSSPGRDQAVPGSPKKIESNGNHITTASTASANGDVLPDLAPIQSMEPHIGVIAKLEQHAKDVPNQQAIMCDLQTNAFELTARHVYRWCDDKSGKDTPITYGELWRNTRQIIYILLKKLKLSRVRVSGYLHRGVLR